MLPDLRSFILHPQAECNKNRSWKLTFITLGKTCNIEPAKNKAKSQGEVVPSFLKENNRFEGIYFDFQNQHQERKATRAPAKSHLHQKPTTIFLYNF